MADPIVKLSSLHILVSTPVSFHKTRFNKLVAISDRSRCSNILNVRRNDETKISNVHFNHTYHPGRCTWGENNLMVVILTPDTIIIGFSQTWVTLQGQVLPHTHSAQSENVYNSWIKKIVTITTVTFIVMCPYVWNRDTTEDWKHLAIQDSWLVNIIITDAYVDHVADKILLTNR